MPFYPILFLPSDSNVSLPTHGCPSERGEKEIEKKKQNSTSLNTGKHSGLNFLLDSGQVSWQLVIWTYFRFQSKFHRALLPPSGPPLENKKMLGLA